MTSEIAPIGAIINTGVNKRISNIFYSVVCLLFTPERSIRFVVDKANVYKDLHIFADICVHAIITYICIYFDF